jgi:hypothetical protein
MVEAREGVGYRGRGAIRTSIKLDWHLFVETKTNTLKTQAPCLQTRAPRTGAGAPLRSVPHSGAPLRPAWRPATWRPGSRASPRKERERREERRGEKEKRERRERGEVSEQEGRSAAAGHSGLAARPRRRQQGMYAARRRAAARGWHLRCGKLSRGAGRPESQGGKPQAIHWGTVPRSTSVLVHTVTLVVVCVPCYVVCRHARAQNTKKKKVVWNVGQYSRKHRKSSDRVNVSDIPRQCPRHSQLRY